VLSFALAAALFQPADQYKVVGYSSPRISPSGTRLLFTRARVDLETDHRDSELVVMDLATRAQRVLTIGRTSVSDPSWSPQGDAIAFVAPDADKHREVFVLPADGGEAARATDAKTGVDEYAWRPDGGAIAYLTADSAPKRTGVARFQDSYRVTTNAYLDTGPFLPSHLWLATLRREDGRQVWSSRRLTSGAWSVGSASISWSPDGATLAYIRVPGPIVADGDDSTVRLLDVATGKSRALTGRSALEWQPQFAPRGGAIAYTYARDGDPNNAGEVYVSDGGGPGRDVSRALDRNAVDYAWYPNGRGLLLEGNDGTHRALWRVPLDGAASRIDLGDLDAFGDFAGSIAADGAIAFVGATPHRPGEIYYLAAGASTPRRLTDGNAWADPLALGRVATLDWTSGGFAEDGVVIYPPGYDASRAYPLVLSIHGGPTGASTSSFDVLGQLMAARGYIVFQPNYRGSDNLGNAYQRAVYRDPVTGPDRDIMAGVAALERASTIDKGRVCVSGWSYGGLMTSWLITQHDVFRCAISGAAVDDQVYDTVLADDLNVNEYSMWGPPFASAASLALYRSASPLTYYRNVRAATLILDDTYDVRVPAAESYAFFHALQDAGKTVEFYQWPVSAHFPGDPIRRADVYRRWLDWLDRYLK
jgi:dipeptidyl aminopeptidase/acylaminoacyl peptidase